MKLSDGIKPALGRKRILQVVGKLCGWTLSEAQRQPDELRLTLLFSPSFDLLSGRYCMCITVTEQQGPEASIKMHLYFPCCLLYLFFSPFFSKVKMMELQSPERKRGIKYRQSLLRGNIKIQTVSHECIELEFNRFCCSVHWLCVVVLTYFSVFLFLFILVFFSGLWVFVCVGQFATGVITHVALDYFPKRDIHQQDRILQSPTWTIK